MTATVYGSYTTTTKLFTVANSANPSSSLGATFTVSNGVASNLNSIATGLISSDPTGQLISYADYNTGKLVIHDYSTGQTYNINATPRDTQQGIIFAGGTNSTVFIADPQGNFLRINPPNTTLNSDVQLYSSVVAISDMGSTSLNTSDWNPGPSWYLGSISVEWPRFPLLPYSLYSQHNRYRVTLSTLNTSIGNFPTIPYYSACALSRSNEFRMLQNATKIQLGADGNVVAQDGSGNVIWQNAMHDGVNNNNAYVTVSNTRPGISTNTFIYMTQFDLTSRFFYMRYYPYNNVLFRNYGLTSDPTFNASLTAQSNFCWSNLQTNPNDPNNISFSDPSCTCIGGQRLFDNLFVNVDLMPESQKALLLDSLPCLMADCSAARGLNPPTNWARLLQDKCKVPITICSSTIRVEDQASLGGVSVIQNCGGDVTTPCTKDADCPVGTICTNDVCVTGCSNANDCGAQGLPGYECRNGVCVNPNAGKAGPLSVGAIVGIAIAGIAVVLLVILLPWYFLVQRPKLIKEGKLNPDGSKPKTTNPDKPKAEAKTKPSTEAKPTTPSTEAKPTTPTQAKPTQAKPTTQPQAKPTTQPKPTTQAKPTTQTQAKTTTTPSTQPQAKPPAAQAQTQAKPTAQAKPTTQPKPATQTKV